FPLSFLGGASRGSGVPHEELTVRPVEDIAEIAEQSKVLRLAVQDEARIPGYPALQQILSPIRRRIVRNMNHEVAMGLPHQPVERLFYEVGGVVCWHTDRDQHGTRFRRSAAFIL